MKLPKRIVVLSSAEYGLAFNGMLHFRNKLIQQGRYTDPVDELLIKFQFVYSSARDTVLLKRTTILWRNLLLCKIPP